MDYLCKGVFQILFTCNSKSDCYDEYPEHRYNTPFGFSTLLICCPAKSPCASSNGCCCVHYPQSCNARKG